MPNLNLPCCNLNLIEVMTGSMELRAELKSFKKLMATCTGKTRPKGHLFSYYLSKAMAKCNRIAFSKLKSSNKLKKTPNLANPTQAKHNT